MAKAAAIVYSMVFQSIVHHLATNCLSQTLKCPADHYLNSLSHICDPCPLACLQPSIDDKVRLTCGDIQLQGYCTTVTIATSTASPTEAKSTTLDSTETKVKNIAIYSISAIVVVGFAAAVVAVFVRKRILAHKQSEPLPESAKSALLSPGTAQSNNNPLVTESGPSASAASKVQLMNLPEVNLDVASDNDNQPSAAVM